MNPNRHIPTERRTLRDHRQNRKPEPEKPRPPLAPPAEPLTVICWKWQGPTDYRSSFGAESVNVLRRMVRRHYARPHRFCCVTNQPEGLDAGIEVIPDRADFANVPSPHGGKNPSCYRRLRMFAPDAAETFGPRLVSLDLDCVIVRDMSPVWDRSEDFVIWGDTNPKTLYNGSMVMLTAGARPKVWTEFDPMVSPKKAQASGNFGSDQAWISYCLGKGEAKWTRADGVYSYRNEIMHHGGRLPVDARIVMFHGVVDPWSPAAQRLPWVRCNWR